MNVGSHTTQVHCQKARCTVGLLAQSIKMGRLAADMVASFYLRV